MCISIKDRVPERDVGEADEGGDMEEEVEGDEELRVVGETSKSRGEARRAEISRSIFEAHSRGQGRIRR